MNLPPEFEANGINIFIAGNIVVTYGKGMISNVKSWNKIKKDAL
jgi:hypothetical protein